MHRLAVLIVSASCYAPQISPGAPCPDGLCPAGLVCSPATTTCERHAADAGRRDAPPDVAPDARPGDAAPNVPKLVQQKTNYVLAADMLSATLGATPASGHLLVMIGGNPSGTLTSVTGGGTWTRAAFSTANSNIELWYATADGSSATVTIARTANASPMWLSVSEWSGLALPIATDGMIATFGATSPASAGSIMTGGPALVLFGVSDLDAGAFGTPAPGTWTTLGGITNTATYIQGEWAEVAASAGTFAPAVSEVAHHWDAVLAGFKYVP